MILVRAPASFASLVLLLLSAGCPQTAITPERCNDSRDCLAGEQCDDGECVDVETPNEPAPGPNEPSVAEPDAEPSVEPGVEPDVGPEPASDAGAPELSDAGVLDDGGSAEPESDGGASPEPDAPVDGGVDAADGGPILDGGAPNPNLYDGTLVKVEIPVSDVNAGETLVVEVYRVEPDTECVLVVGDEQVVVDAAGTETFLPDQSGTVNMQCLRQDVAENFSLDFRVFTIDVDVFRDASGDARGQVTTSHSESCQASLNDGPVIWEGDGNATAALPVTDGSLTVECDGANETTIVAVVDFVVGVVSVNAPELTETVDGIAAIAWQLEDGALCTLTLNDSIVIAPETFYPGGTAVTPIDNGDGGIDGDWTFSCRNTLGEADSAFLIVSANPSGADASDVQFDLIPTGTGVGTEVFAVEMAWSLVGDCTLDGLRIANQGEQILEPNSPQSTLIFACQSGEDEDINAIRVAVGQILYPTTFDPHVVIGTAAYATENTGSFGALQVASEAVGVVAGGAVSAPNLETVGTGLYIGETQIDAFDAPRLRSIKGELTVSAVSIGTIALPSLVDVGDVSFESANVAVLQLDALTTILGDFSMDANTGLDALDLPQVRVVGGEIRIRESFDLSRVSAQQLDIASDIRVSDCSDLALFDLRNLSLSERVTIEDNPLLYDVHLDSLSQVSSLVSIRFNSDLEFLTGGSLAFASSVNISNNVSLPNAAAEAFVDGAFVEVTPTTCPNASPCGG